MCKILNCPECEDRDCCYNAEGLCYNVDTIRNKVPGGMFTCSGAEIGFKRNDYYLLDEIL